MTPRLVVIGTGRSGTHSIADMFHVEHEPNQFHTVQLAWQYVHRASADDVLKKILSGPDWPDVVVDYKMLELIPLVAEMWNPKFLFIVRNARDTVASMVEKGWYDPEDDTLPAAYLWWWTKKGELWQDANYQGHRTRADRLGLVTEPEWAAMSQPERCCWWWSHAVRVAATMLNGRDHWAGALENLDVETLAAWSGYELDVLPHVDKTDAEWDSRWEPFYDRWCADTEAVLGYKRENGKDTP